MWTERRSDANEPFLIFSPWCPSDRVQHRLLRADPNKHVEHVKPSYTAPFDVLTFEILSRETVFQEVGVFEYWKRCLQAAPFFLPNFFRSFAILLLAHWPKVSLRMCCLNSCKLTTTWMYNFITIIIIIIIIIKFLLVIAILPKHIGDAN